MTVRSSINPTPALPNIMQPKMPHDNKIPLQTIINNNLWKARALNDRNQITKANIFAVCILSSHPDPFSF